MARPDQGLDLLLARWVVGELAPEEVPALATDALAHGCAAASVAVLAGLSRPTSSDIEAELPAFLHELGLSLPSTREAVKAAVDGLAREIVLGIVTPPEGAERMWRSYANDANADGDDQLWEQLLVFVGLAVEREEENRPASVIDKEIVDAAKTLLASGGLRISPLPEDTVE